MRTTNQRRSPFYRRTIGAAFVITTAALCGCLTDPIDDTGEVSSAGSVGPTLPGKPVCDLKGLLKLCTVGDTDYVGLKVKNNDLGGSGTPSNTGVFNCANFAGALCRCAETACPGAIGKTLFQQIVRCTAYKDCSIINQNHVMEIMCEPSADGTKKTCSCVGPQRVFTGNDDVTCSAQAGSGAIYGSAEIGINDTPGANFCEKVYCDAKLPKDWKSCGGETLSTCGNTNKKDGCPSDCCKDAKGNVPAYCTECKVDGLAYCKGQEPKIEPNVQPTIR